MNDLPENEEGWQVRLTPMQFHVLRGQGTERAFTGEYWNHEGEGTYHCAGCDTPLFTSGEKFHSGCGWPSFTAALTSEATSLRSDRSHGMVRTEVIRASCQGHLGHVFDDGPPPTGKRFCINSAALRFVGG